MTEYVLSDITIVLPTFKRMDKFVLTLDSYLKNEPREIIVVDDCSECDYDDYISSLGDARVKLITHSQNKGSPIARQTGLKEVNTELIFMGEDDVLMPMNYLSSLLELFNNKKVDVLASRLLQLNSREETCEAALSRVGELDEPLVSLITLNSNFEVSTAYIETPFLHACSLFKKKILETTEYVFYSGNAYREETDFYFQCYRKGFTCAFTSQACAFHMYHDDEGGHGFKKAKAPFRYHCFWPIYNNNKFINKYWREISELTGLASKFKCKWLFCRVTILSYLHINYPRIFKLIRRCFNR
jgi:glycosyltransferase involved in cell wall biosynthesis